MHWVGVKVVGYNLLGVIIAYLFVSFSTVWSMIFLGGVIGITENAYSGYWGLMRSVWYISSLALFFVLSYGIFVPQALEFSSTKVFVANHLEDLSEDIGSHYDFIKIIPAIEKYYIKSTSSSHANIIQHTENKENRIPMYLVGDFLYDDQNPPTDLSYYIFDNADSTKQFLQQSDLVPFDKDQLENRILRRRVGDIFGYKSWHIALATIMVLLANGLLLFDGIKHRPKR